MPAWLANLSAEMQSNTTKKHVGGGEISKQ